MLIAWFYRGVANRRVLMGETTRPVGGRRAMVEWVQGGREQENEDQGERGRVKKLVGREEMRVIETACIEAPI